MLVGNMAYMIPVILMRGSPPGCGSGSVGKGYYVMRVRLFLRVRTHRHALGIKIPPSGAGVVWE